LKNSRFRRSDLLARCRPRSWRTRRLADGVVESDAKSPRVSSFREAETQRYLTAVDVSGQDVCDATPTRYVLVS
jgi:hypothetical protein